MYNRLFYVVQICTISRAFLGVVLILISAEKIPQRDKIIGILIVFLLGIFLDVLDGFLARRWAVSSEIGKFLDPTIDGIFFSLVALSLNKIGIISIGIPTLVLSRTILITGYRVYLTRHHRSVESLISGKIKTFIMSLCVICILINALYGIENTKNVEILISLIIFPLMIFSFVDFLVKRRDQ